MLMYRTIPRIESNIFIIPHSTSLCDLHYVYQMQGDFSILDRKSEENGVAEAASPYNENVGFMAYNALAGGMLTGKYM